MKVAPFIWPQEVSTRRELLPGGVFAYTLSHAALGRLGRLLITPVRGGGARLDCEVWAEGTPAQIERRRAVLEPLGRAVSARLCGR